MQGTAGDDYAERLLRKQRVWWKRALNVQAPYQWNIRRQRLGRTLDIGCGIGRNLANLPAGSVGVDHNARAIQVATASGVNAMTVDDFLASELAIPESFDGILVAHVIEHLSRDDARSLMTTYLPYLKPGGRTFLVCPQERGYASDATHVEFVDGHALQELAQDVGLVPETWFSFPFPRWAGKAFIYNEFCLAATKPA